MTLLAAILQPVTGRFLVAADRLAPPSDDQTGTPHALYVDKWTTVSRAPRLMWGWSGSRLVGERLQAWLDDEADCSGWTTLKSGVSYELRRLNLDRTGERDLRNLTECLIAGFVDGEPGILHVGFRGELSWRADVPQNDPWFMGRSHLKADFAWEYARRFPPAKGTVTRHFFDLMHLVISDDDLLGGFAAWDIPPDRDPTRIVCEEPQQARG